MADDGSLIVFRAAYCARNGPEIDGWSCGSAVNGPSLDYWRARERSERAAAKRARTAMARAIHQELAQEYAARIRGFDGKSSIVSRGQR
jgi:hypothetical protein